MITYICFRNFKGFRGNAQIQNEHNIKNQDRPIPKKTQVEQNPMKQTAFKDTNTYEDPDEMYEDFEWQSQASMEVPPNI